MKKAQRSLLLIFFFLASLVPPAGAWAQDPLKKVPLGEGLPDENKGAEPLMVYGYIALVDPASGQKHLILSRAYDPPVAQGYPTFHIVFYHVGTKERRRVTFRAGEGLTQVGFSGTETSAYLYGAELRQDQAFMGDPTMVSISGHVLTRAIRYNPDTWRFLTVEMGPYDTFSPSGERIDLSRREK